MVDLKHLGAPQTNSTKNKNAKVIMLKPKSSLESYSLKSKAAIISHKNKQLIKKDLASVKKQDSHNKKVSPKKHNVSKITMVPKSKLILNKDFDGANFTMLSAATIKQV